ncbi:DUF4423 domain-containing protein [bacterium]|nr:DUF4423 domain-containing protein [bacterium]
MISKHMQSVYEADHFLDFLHGRIDSNRETRGYQSRLSEAAGCQRSFLSQVLHSSVLPTPDHALGMCSFWNLDTEETEYFLNLVQHARAQSPLLRKHLEKGLRDAKSRQRDIATRVKRPSPTLSHDALTEYYSAWYYAAIHIAAGLKRHVTAEFLSERLSLPLSVVTRVLKFLNGQGLVVQAGNRWQVTVSHLHLPKSSLLTRTNHLNWRQKAMDATHVGEDQGLRYSLVFSASRKDVEKIEKKILELIEETRKTIESSGEEDLVCFLCDYFPLIR